MRNNRSPELLRQGFNFTVPRYVFIDDGRVDALSPYPIDSDYQTYDALDLENLPNSFARVTEEKSVKKFVERYGLLGYHDAPDEEAVAPYCSPNDYREPIGYEGSLTRQLEKPFGEPIAWILDQAGWVAFCMELIEAITNDPNRLFPKLVRRSMGKLEFKEMIEDGEKVFYRDYYDGTIRVRDDPRRFLPQKREEFVESFSIMAGPNRLSPGVYRGSTLEIARKVVADSVVANTISIKTTFQTGPEGFVLRYEANSLIEVIWWHISQSALLAESQGKLIGLCSECGRPFVANSRREQYCPPDEFSRQSLCGARNRMRRLRTRNKRTEIKDKRL